MIESKPQMALNAEGYAKLHSIALEDLGNKTALVRYQVKTNEIKG